MEYHWTVQNVMVKKEKPKWFIFSLEYINNKKCQDSYVTTNAHSDTPLRSYISWVYVSLYVLHHLDSQFARTYAWLKFETNVGECQYSECYAGSSFRALSLAWRARGHRHNTHGRPQKLCKAVSRNETWLCVRTDWIENAKLHVVQFSFVAFEFHLCLLLFKTGMKRLLTLRDLYKTR